MGNSKINNILIPNVTKLPSQKVVENNKLNPGEVSEFKSLLDSSITPEENSNSEGDVENAINAKASKGISLSTHAMKRLQERNLSMDKEEIQKLQSAIDKLKTKGGQDSLVITGKGAYIVDVSKNKIVTAIDKDSIGENVFTKIDSTILMN
jgi:flagellar operon protein